MVKLTHVFQLRVHGEDGAQLHRQLGHDKPWRWCGWIDIKILRKQTMPHRKWW